MSKVIATEPHLNIGICSLCSSEVILGVLDSQEHTVTDCIAALGLHVLELSIKLNELTNKEE